MAEMDKADDIIQQALMNNPKKFVRDFSQVVMNLENVLIPEEKIHNPPSILDGLSEETDAYLRILGCEMIQTAGFLLQLPQVAMATGQVLYQRFYYIKSFVKHNYEVVAMASITLASKIEEAPRRIRDVANVFHHIKQIRNQKLHWYVEQNHGFRIRDYEAERQHMVYRLSIFKSDKDLAVMLAIPFIQQDV